MSFSLPIAELVRDQIDAVAGLDHLDDCVPALELVVNEWPERGAPANFEVLIVAATPRGRRPRPRQSMGRSRRNSHRSAAPGDRAGRDCRRQHRQERHLHRGRGIGIARPSGPRASSTGSSKDPPRWRQVPARWVLTVSDLIEKPPEEIRPDIFRPRKRSGSKKP